MSAVRWAPAVALGVGLLLLVSPAAMAQEGYILNPSGNDTTRQVEPDGMSHIRKTRRRTPTGFLYPYPLEPQTLRPIGGGWLAGGSTEIGGISVFGDENETRFSRYADWSRNFLLHSLDLVVLHEERGILAEVRGGGVGRTDQHLGAEIAWLGRARLRVEHSGVPRTHAKDARTPYRGLGGERLTLVPALTPGNNSDDALVTELAGQSNRNLSVQRDETRVQLELSPRSDTRLRARFGSQDRQGERAYGGSWLYSSGAGLARGVEFVMPVDDHTYAAEVGLEFARQALQVNAGYKGSYYRNEHRGVTWDNPFLLPGFNSPELVERGRLALAPENDFHNFRADVAGRLPYGGRGVFTASWSRMTQDDSLLPPTVNSGVLGSLDLDQWNTRAALARSGANARVETLLLLGDLSFRPWRRLKIGGRVRYFDRDSETRYTARNPLTDEFGYIAEDGALAAVFGSFRQAPIANPMAPEDFRYRSTPYGYDQLEIQTRADATLPGRTRLLARYGWERRGYDERERSASEEHRVRLTLSTRLHESSNLRLSYRYANRDGDGYDFDPYDAYYLSSLTGGPAELAFTLAQLRKHDLANREQHEVELRWNFLLRDDMDLGLSGRFRADAYGSRYGLNKERSGSLHMDWSYAPSQHLHSYWMGSWERTQRDQDNLNDTFGGGGGLDPNAGGALFPFMNRWELGSEQDSFFTGVGLAWRFLERFSVETGYRLIYTRQELDYDLAGLGALSPFAPAAAGSRFPDLETLDHVLDSSLRVSLTEAIAVRVFHRFQRGEIGDFQQAGIRNPDLARGTAGTGAGVLFIGHQDRDYSAHVVGATLQVRFFE